MEVRLVFSPLLICLCYLKVLNEISSLLYVYQKYLPTERFQSSCLTWIKTTKKIFYLWGNKKKNSTGNLAGVFNITKKNTICFHSEDMRDNFKNLTDSVQSGERKLFCFQKKMVPEIISKRPYKLSLREKQVNSHVQLPNRSLTLFQKNNNETLLLCYDSFISDMIN